MAKKLTDIIHPVLSDDTTLSLDFGNTYSDGSFHKGIDVYSTQKKECNVISPVIGKITAMANNIKGKVADTTSVASMGNYVTLVDDNGYTWRFQHMKYNSVVVKVGDRVKEGDKLGVIGNTGNSNGRHLHTDVSKSGKLSGGTYVTKQKRTYFDPKKFICGTVSAPKSKVAYTVTANLLNVRFDASMQAGIKRQIRKGTKVFVTEKKNDFGRIGDDEWVCLTYIKEC